MLGAITILLVYQLIGEVISKYLGLPLPGPVVGMALLFLTLLVRGGVTEEMQKTARGFLAHLSLLFVPAGVGVMMHLGLIRDEWQAITLALLGSTLLTVIVTAWVMARLDRIGTTDASPGTGEGRAP